MADEHGKRHTKRTHLPQAISDWFIPAMNQASSVVKEDQDMNKCGLEDGDAQDGREWQSMVENLDLAS